MSLSEVQSLVLRQGIAIWFRNFGGASASDIASNLSRSHDDVCRAVEELEQLGYGKLNRDIELFQVSFDPESPDEGFTHTPLKTHIFFPSKGALREAFYSSDIPAKNLPEYVVRLHLGTQQIELVFFSEEVLSRYFDHPELYDIGDTLAGGEISARGQDVDNRYLYVRYGKCRLRSGAMAVTAICKDLADMGVAEQRHWHSHEIVKPDLEHNDPNFQTFLSRTYDGSWVDYPDPISELLGAMHALNSRLAPRQLFTRLENVHLRLPVEQTYKSFCDCASELFKLVGPDALSQSTMKGLLQCQLSVTAAELVHGESKRPLSSMQLLALLESRLALPGNLSAVIQRVSKLRIDADHRVLGRDLKPQSYSEEFASLCKEVAAAVTELAGALGLGAE